MKFLITHLNYLELLGMDNQGKIAYFFNIPVVMIK